MYHDAVRSPMATHGGRSIHGCIPPDDAKDTPPVEVQNRSFAAALFVQTLDSNRKAIPFRKCRKSISLQCSFNRTNSTQQQSLGAEGFAPVVCLGGAEIGIEELLT